jgi:hypothetical protein
LAGINDTSIWISGNCTLDLAPLQSTHRADQPSQNLSRSLAIRWSLLIEYTLEDTPVSNSSQYIIGRGWNRNWYDVRLLQSSGKDLRVQFGPHHREVDLVEEVVHDELRI